jgi:hypothetical protein
MKISGLADTVPLCGHLGFLTLTHWIFIFGVIFIKWVVYETEIDNENELCNRIQNGLNEIRNNLEIFDSVRNSIRSSCSQKKKGTLYLDEPVPVYKQMVGVSNI